MKPSIPAVLGSMFLGAALTLPITDPANAAAGGRRLQTPYFALKIDRSLLNASGPVDVIVQLSGEPLAVANGPDARREGGRLNRAQQIAHSQKIRSDQDAVLAKVIALGGKEIGRVRIAYNAAIVRIDASKATKLASLPGVSAVQRASDFRINLVDTVPYVGAAAVQAAGITGKGVRVAVLDSGVDYTHYNLGGAGTAAAYTNAWGTSAADVRNTTPEGFPTPKVVDGYDFVGEAWAGGAGSPPLAEDPDPIDADGHGTHVTDIIAGRSNDGKHVGVAPGASLLAVKVCSAVSTSCSGVALLRGIDFALDPNGDGSMDDAADVINMSLGAPYGQREDSTAVAAANAARAGVVVVVAAGNSGDKPYDLSSPGIAPEVITVAQTQVPSAVAIPLVITSPTSIAGAYGNTATIEWAPVEEDGTEGTVAYVGQGCLADAYNADPAGKIALIDRGACNISEKVRRASDAGAIGIIIGLIAPGDAVSFSNGGQCPVAPDGTCKPTIVVQQSLSLAIRANVASGVNAQISPANGIPLFASLASTTARGPSYGFNHIKPDIAAPGASVSAEVGTGTGETAFGGTSGATPMVAGAAALMLEAYPNRTPWAIKSVLMNTADPEVYTNPVFLPGVLAPITRIGAGEVQVNKAVASTTAAWDTALRAGSLSFGYHNVSDTKTLVRTVRVQNYSGTARRYDVSNAFRYANDAASGAVKLITPGSVFVPPFGSTTFDVVMKIDATRLPVWGLFGGWNNGTGSLLQTVEFDGYLTLKDSKDTVRLAWHVLPHKSADLHVVNRNVVIPGKGFGLLAMANIGKALPGAFDLFNLTGTSPRLRRSQLPEEDETTIHDLAAAGIRYTTDADGFPAVQFAINTYGRRSHPAYPGRFDVFVDSNNDGVNDFRVFNAENGDFDTTGETLVGIDDLSIEGPDDAVAYYYADVDLDSGNLIMTVPPEAIEVAEDQKFRFAVEAHDNYFASTLEDGLTDAIRGMVFTLNTPKFVATSDLLPGGGVPPSSGLLLKVNGVPGGDKASPSQSGFLLMYRDAADEADTVTVYQGGKK